MTHITQTKPRERPILFNGDMVRALLAGAKTQTRRIVKITHRTPGLASCLEPPAGLKQRPGLAAELCPYGQPGDRLWVREPFKKIIGNSGYWIETDYRATYKHGDRLGDHLGEKHKWTPSIHMPRAASRITLEITDVRVEKLHDISRGDAMDEGCPFPNMAQGDNPRTWYADLWNSINGPGSWDTNPWVWVVAFRVVKP